MKSNILLLFVAFLVLNSCNQENIKYSAIDNESSIQALVIGDDKTSDADFKEEDKGKEDCFQLVFPITLTMPDGTSITGDKAALWDALKSWYESNPNSVEKPSLNYPVDIKWKEDYVKTIADEEEMVIAKKYCDQEKKDCFELVYPITWTMPDGTTVTMSDDKDWSAIKSWYTANPDSEDKFHLNYPVDVLLEDGTAKMVANDDEMAMIKKECK